MIGVAIAIGVILISMGILSIIGLLPNDIAQGPVGIVGGVIFLALSPLIGKPADWRNKHAGN